MMHIENMKCKWMMLKHLYKNNYYKLLKKDFLLINQLKQDNLFLLDHNKQLKKNLFVINLLKL